MKKFKFEREFSGYVRGTEFVVIDAANLDDAKEKVTFSYADSRDIVRDDTSSSSEWSLSP